jgi:hypothetical protein
MIHVNVLFQMERLIEKNYYLHKSARDGYRSYLQAYASHSLKSVFNVNNLDLQQVARAFGFAVPPSVNLSILCTEWYCVWNGNGKCISVYLKWKWE